MIENIVNITLAVRSSFPARSINLWKVFYALHCPNALAAPGVLGFTEFCLYPMRGCYILIPLTLLNLNLNR